MGFFSSRFEQSKLTEKPEDRQENLYRQDPLVKRLEAIFDDNAFDDRIFRLIELGIPRRTQTFLLSLRKQFKDHNRLSERQWEILEEMEENYY